MIHLTRTPVLPNRLVTFVLNLNERRVSLFGFSSYAIIFIFFHLPPCARHPKSDILRTRSPEGAGRRSLKIVSWKLKRITTRMTRSDGEVHPERGKSFLLSVYGRTTDALASVGYEGRGRLRQASGSRQQALIRRSPNGATRPPSSVAIQG